MTAQKNIDKFQLQFWVALFSVSFVSSTLPGFGTELETFKWKKTQQTISIRTIRQIFGATIKPRNKKKTQQRMRFWFWTTLLNEKKQTLRILILISFAEGYHADTRTLSTFSSLFFSNFYSFFRFIPPMYQFLRRLISNKRGLKIAQQILTKEVPT